LPLTAALPDRGQTASTMQNRQAQRRLALAFGAISLAIGLSQAWFGLTFVYAEGGYGPIKLSLMGLVYAWVMVPALGLLRRGGWGRVGAGGGGLLSGGAWGKWWGWGCCCGCAPQRPSSSRWSSGGSSPRSSRPWQCSPSPSAATRAPRDRNCCPYSWFSWARR